MVDERVPLSEREIEVLIRVASGASNQEIARDLVISVNTVKVHLRNVFEKLGVQSRTEATLYAIRNGLVAVDAQPSEDTQVPAEAEAAASLPRPSARVRPHTWQRACVGGVLVLTSAMLVLPALNWESRATATASLISDRPGAGAAPAWVTTARWAKYADLPTPRTRLALATYRGQLFAIGGDRESGVTGLVEAYDRDSDVWSTRAVKPTPVSNIGAAVVQDRIYVPGGCTGLTNATRQLEVYHPALDRWTQAAPLPSAVCAYTLAAVDNRVYMFGGWEGQAFVNQVWMYDPERDSWTERAPLPGGRGFAAAGVVNGVVYVVGGYDGEQELADTLAYSVADDSWSERKPMNAGRAGLGVAVVDDQVYAIGGGWQSYLATNERYDPASDSWAVFESPVLGQWRNLGVAALDTDIYAVGGWSGDYLGVNQAYHALFRLMLPVLQ